MTTRLNQSEISTTGNVTGNIVRTDNYQYANGTPFTGTPYSNSSVATFMADFGSNTISTTGNVTSGYLFGNGSQLTGIAAVSSYGNSNVTTLLSDLGSNTVSTTGNITSGYFVGNGSQLTGIVAVSSYANSNVATFMANYGSNTVSTTGNISGGYFVGNGSQLTGIVAVSSYANSNVATFMANFGSNTVSTTGNVTSGYLFGTGNATISGAANTKTHVQVNTFGAGLTNSESGGQFIGSYTRTGSSVGQGDGLAGLYGYGSADGSTLLANAAAFIELQAATTWSNTSAPSHISFFVCDGSGIVANRVAQLNANGNLQIYNGNLSVANGNILAAGLSVTGNIEGNVVAPDGNGSIVVNASGVLGAIAGLNYTANTLFAPSMSPQGTANVGTNSLFVGLPAFVPLGSNVATQITSNVDSYSQLNMQNISSANIASGDYIITANNGTDSTYFLDLGMASSTYDFPGFGAIGPNDGYLFVAGNDQAGPSNGTSNLNIGSTNGNIRSWIGAGEVANIVTTVHQTGFNVDGDISATGNVTASVAFQLPVYANTTARDTAISSPAIGMLVVVGNVYQGYNGATWGNITLS